MSFNAAVFKDAEGKVAGIFATARDITAQKKTEDKLRDAQNYNRGLIEASPDALVTVATDLVITDVNEQMLRLTEVLRAKVSSGASSPELFTDPSRATQGVALALRDGAVSNYELLLRKRNGQKDPGIVQRRDRLRYGRERPRRGSRGGARHHGTGRSSRPSYANRKTIPGGWWNRTSTG